MTELNLPSDSCGDDKLYEDGCNACLGNSYRDSASSQFEECKKCPAGKQPTTKNDGCVTCDPGVSKINKLTKCRMEWKIVNYEAFCLFVYYFFGSTSNI